jgi:hypothetical protein
MTVVVHQVAAARILEDRCAKCSGELDVGYECNECGFDNFDIATQYEDPADHVNRRTMKARGFK